MRGKKEVLDILSPDQIIEVVSIKNDEIVIKEMTLQQYKDMKKNKGYVYRPFQLGFSQFPGAKRISTKK